MAVHDAVLRKGGTDGGGVNIGKIIGFLPGPTVLLLLLFVLVLGKGDHLVKVKVSKKPGQIIHIVALNGRSRLTVYLVD